MLHTLDAAETITRIVAAFPPYQQKQVRLQLGTIIKGIISQRLVPMADGRGRIPAAEVLVSTGTTREMIEDPERTKELRDAIANGYTSYGMQTFDQSLMNLLQQKLISYDEALRNCSNPDDFALRFQGISSTSDAKWDNFEAGGAPAAQQPATVGRPAAPHGATPSRPQPAAKPATPPAGGGGGGNPNDDDMQIERF